MTLSTLESQGYIIQEPLINTNVMPIFFALASIGRSRVHNIPQHINSVSPLFVTPTPEDDTRRRQAHYLPFRSSSMELIRYIPESIEGMRRHCSILNILYGRGEIDERT